MGPDNTVRSKVDNGLPGYVRGVLTNWARATSPAPGSLHHDDLLFRLHRNELPDDFHDLSVQELLDLVDALLHLRQGPWKRYVGSRRPVDELRRLLIGGGAAWTLTANEDGLERRVIPSVADAVVEAVQGALDAGAETPAAQAGEHLTRAWDAAYGVEPDPDRAYDEAVLAVEAVSCPLICPNNDMPTLGTAIRDLTSQSSQWVLVIGDKTGQPSAPDRLVGMLKLLWEGQSRHAGATNSRRQSRLEAEASVHLAVTLVQWLSNGVLRRR